MVKKIELKAEKRDGKNDAKQLRQDGFIPAVLYGQGGEAQAVKINKNEFEKVFDVAGESSLIDLSVKGGDTIKTIVKNVQRDTLRGQIIHIDLYKIDMKTAIETEIPIHFEGESKAEKSLGGTLVKNLETVHVKCLPGDLVEFFAVDLAKLETFDDAIRISDIVISEGQEIMSNPEDLIANVVPPRISAEEDEAEETEVEGEEAKGEKADGEEKSEAEAEKKE